MALVTAVAWFRSLAWELLHVQAWPKKKKKKKKKEKEKRNELDNNSIDVNGRIAQIGTTET